MSEKDKKVEPVTLTITDPELIEALNDGELALVKNTEISRAISFLKENSFADVLEELHNDYDFGIWVLEKNE